MDSKVKITTHLNKAAFFILRGAEFKYFVGSNPYHCKLVVEIDGQVLHQIDQEKDYVVDYQKYMRLRSELKKKIKRTYGLRTR